MPGGNFLTRRTRCAHFDAALTEESGRARYFCTHVSNVFGYILPVERIARRSAAHAGCRSCWTLRSPPGRCLSRCGSLARPFLRCRATRGSTARRVRESCCADSCRSRSWQAGRGLSKVSVDPGLPCGPGGGRDAQCAGDLRAGRGAGIRPAAGRGRDLPARVCAAEGALPGTCSSDVECFTGAAQSRRPVRAKARARMPSKAGAAAGGADVCVRAGLHCAPLAHESAGTLETGTVRLGISAFNTAREIAQAAAILKK